MALSKSDSPSLIEPADPDAKLKHYFLVSVPYSSTTPQNPAYHGRTLRYTGSGHSDVVLTEGKPVFLRFYLEAKASSEVSPSSVWRPTGKQMAVSSKADAKVFGFTIGDGKGEISTPNPDENSPYKDEQPIPGSIAVEMHPGHGDDGFYFEHPTGSSTDEQWVLKWSPRDQKARDWRGFLLRDSPNELFKGNPRLFWDGGEGEMSQLGPGWARVNLVREYL
jgi:hypothetical protein